MEFTGIHHAAFATGDMDRTIRFWRDLVGLRLVASLSRKREKQYFFALNEASFLSFFEWPGTEPVPFKRHGEPVRGPYHFDHLALGLEKGEDLVRIQSILEREEYPVSDIVDHGFIHSIYTYDPNGIPLEFNTSIDGVDLIQEPILADANPPAAAQEGPEPSPSFNREKEPDLEYFTIPGDGATEFGPERSGQ